ncbi:MAG: serine hydrolase domain-containing protein [Pseudomonadota bacterium]
MAQHVRSIGGAAISTDLKDHLKRITRDGRYLAAGAACKCRDGSKDAILTGAMRPGDVPGDLSPALGARLRVASISKAATARALAALVTTGQASLDDRVHEILGPVGYPKWLGTPPISLIALLSHTSGLRDHLGYFTDPPETLPGFLSRAGAAMRPGPVGDFFYANLNYVLAGAVIEAISGDRFDTVIQASVLGPLGLGGGFNWAGVDDRQRLPMYQRHGDTYTLEADGPDGDWTANLMWRGDRGLGLGTYRLGRDTHLFSPHAGLRLTLPEMARFAAAIGDDSPESQLCRTAVWTYDGTNGAWSDGLFPNMGLSLTTYQSHDRIPGYLTGHAGHALGFTGGVWCDRDTGTGWAYALTGSADATEGQDEETFFGSAELTIFEAF